MHVLVESLFIPDVGVGQQVEEVCGVGQALGLAGETILALGQDYRQEVPGFFVDRNLLEPLHQVNHPNVDIPWLQAAHDVTASVHLVSDSLDLVVNRLHIVDQPNRWVTVWGSRLLHKKKPCNSWV